MARKFLKRKVATAGRGVRKVRRKKSFQWCAMLDNALQAGAGIQLKDLQVPEAELASPAQPLSWLLAGGVIDKGSDGVCGSNFLVRKLRLNLSIWYDPSHGAWRSCLGALSGAGLMTHAFIMLMTYNVGFGEWKDGTRYEQVKTSVQDTIQSCQPADDDIFQFVLPGIIKERGLSEEPRTEELDWSIYESLADGGCWRTIHPQLGFSRFFGVIKRFLSVESNVWSERVYGLMNLCLDLGMLDKASIQEHTKKETAMPAPASSSTAAPAKMSQKQAKADAVHDRRSHRHGVYHAFCVYADRENYYLQWIIASVVSPLHKWHQSQNRMLRSMAGSLEWVTSQCDSGFLEHVVGTLSMVHSRGFFDRWGVEVEFDMSEPGAVDSAHCSQQDHLASKVGAFATCLAASRLTWGLDFLEGWPKRCCLLSSAVPAETQQGAIKQLRHQLDVVDRAMSSDSRKCQEWAARSSLHLTAAQQVIAVLKVNMWQCSSEASHAFKEWSCRLMGTQVLEDGIKAMSQTAKASPTKRISDMSAYHALIHKKVLDKIHSFEAPASTVVATGTRGLSLDGAAFNMNRELVWKELEKIKGTGEPDWYSPKGEDMNATIGELVSMEVVMDDRREHLLPKMITLGGLLNGGQLVLRRKREGQVADDGWLFLLGRLSATCYLGHPAKCSTFSGTDDVFYTYDCTPPWEWHPIVVQDVSEWDVCEYIWASPYHQWIRWPGALQTSSARNCIRAIPKGSMGSLLTLAARGAFWQQSKSWLVDLAKVIQCEVDTSGSLFEILWSLVRFCLACSEDEALQIVSLRAMPPAYRGTCMSVTELMHVEGFRDWFTKDEQKEVQRQADEASRHQSSRSSFKQEYLAKKAQVAKSRQATGHKPGSKKKGNVGDPGLQQYRGMKVPEAAISQHDAAALMPPDCSIWRNWKDHAWRAVCRPHKSFSASWAEYGQRDGALHCIRLAWTMHLDDRGLSTSDCPIQGLFE